ncbi:MAG: hypothetical protein S4CHLAM7_11920 [Chlamydiae bacterium]|nr:hypothetical protein [Chlamydiota bacterium]
MNLIYRKAQAADLSILISLLYQDELGAQREKPNSIFIDKYKEAFQKIDSDPNHYLMVVEQNKKMIGTCHLTLLPSLTYCGSTRMQIEAVRVLEECRNQKVGEWMIKQAITYGQSKGAYIIQLTTNCQRESSIKFYERLGFKASHVGFKLISTKIKK